MAGIRDFVGADTRVKKFLAAREGLPNEEARQLERTLLKPETLPSFTGERPTKSSIDNRTVIIIFEQDEDVELFKQFFRVNNYKGQNTRDVGKLMYYLEALERGSLVLEDDGLYCVTDQGDKVLL